MHLFKTLYKYVYYKYNKHGIYNWFLLVFPSECLSNEHDIFTSSYQDFQMNMTYLLPVVLTDISQWMQACGMSMTYLKVLTEISQ
jgi:hypothetical protein